MVVSQEAGESFDFTVNISDDGLGDAGVAIYIDYDENYEFDSTNELYYSSDAYVEIATGTITIPEDIEPGNYRLRVVSDRLIDSPSPCDAQSAIQDYTLTVIEEGGPIEECETPTDVEVANLTQTTADVTWTTGDVETEWEVIYGETGFDPENEGTSESVMDDQSIQITGLEPGIEYEVYVKAICGADDESEMTDPVSFGTVFDCSAADIPFTQDFENVEAPNLPNCGSIETIAGGDWKTKSTAFGFEGNVLNHGYDSTNELDAWYFTQGINLEAGVNYQISYKYTNGSTLWTDKLKVAFGTSASSEDMTEELVNHESINSIDVLIDEINFTVDNDGVYYFGFQAHSDANQNQIDIDDIHIDVASITCVNPTDLAVDNITTDGVDVSWTPGSDETEWEVLYGEAGFDPDNNEGTSVTVMDDPETTLTDLATDTEYDVYVRAVCTDMSDWTGPESFTTSMETCEAPSDISFTDTDENSTEVSWTENGTATEWELIYGAPNFDPETEGTTVSVGENPATINDLDPNTEYEVYVIAICSDENSSDASTPETFTTGELSVDNPVFENFTFYPNPVKSRLTLKAGIQIENVNVYNLLGQNVLSSKPNTLEMQLNTERLQAGVYLMKVTLDGSTKIFRLIKR